MGDHKSGKPLAQSGASSTQFPPHSLPLVFEPLRTSAFGSAGGVPTTRDHRQVRRARLSSTAKVIKHSAAKITKPIEACLVGRAQRRASAK